MNNYRKKKNRIKIITIVILLIIVLIFTGYSLKKERNLTIVESTIKDITLFIQETLYAPIKYVKKQFEINKEKENIYKKYKYLQKEEDNIGQKNATIDELKKENRELKELLKIDNTLTDYDKINATTISRNLNYWNDKIIINKGKKDGIESKMAVITNSGLIGYVSDVSYNTSNVQLLTSKNLKTKISVKIELEDEKYANGILVGYDEKNKIYKIEGISYSGKINEDAIVTTTGLSDNFPSGIVIGKVKQTTTDNFDLGMLVEVVPIVNFDDINNIVVLKRKVEK